MNWLTRHVPSLHWIPNYDRADLPGDLIAGLTVAVMLIPQGMAYAMLAGLPPIVGLYASIVPLGVYALLGTSRQLAVGPVAMVSLMVASSVGAIAEGGTELYLTLAIALALLVGVLQTAMGLFRLGFLVNFLAHPVISGFTSAAALIIGLSQLKHLLGVPLPRTHLVHETVLLAIEHAAEIHPLTLGIGLAAIAALWLLKTYAKGVPGALVVVSVTTVAVWAFGWADTGVKIVGEVPAGMPMPTVPSFTVDQLTELLPTALAISLVGFMESISVAKGFATRNRYKVDADQELIGLGLANLAGSFFGAYPVTGGFSRTAVNGQAGARTPLASLVTAVLIAISIVFLTPLFYFMPKAVLAAIVMVAVFGLIDLRGAIATWKLRWQDGLMTLATFVATLALGIELGIGVGVVLSLGLFLYRSSRPHVAELGQLPGEERYMNVERFPEAHVPADVRILRMDASLYFANAGFLEDTLEQAAAGDHPLSGVVLDMSSVNSLDTSALHTLEHVAEAYAAHGTALALAAVKGPVRDLLDSAGIDGSTHNILRFDTVHEAVNHLNHPAPSTEGAHTPPGATLRVVS